MQLVDDRILLSLLYTLSFIFWGNLVICHRYAFFFSVWILLIQSVWLFNIFFHCPSALPFSLHYGAIPEVNLQALCNHVVRHCWRKWHSGSFCVHHHQYQIGISQCSVVSVYSSSKYTFHDLQCLFTPFRSILDFSKSHIFMNNLFHIFF